MSKSPDPRLPVSDSDPPAGRRAMTDAQRRRVRDYLLMLARRAEAQPEDAEVISMVLGSRLAEHWEPALEAAMLAAESLDHAQVHPVIDVAIAKLLRDKPDLPLVAELYNRIPLDTVLLRQTSLEVFRQTVKAMEERHRVDLHPAEYLTMLLNYVQRLVQADDLFAAETSVQKALALARMHHARNPASFLDVLASSLETWAVIAAATGGYEKSRDARREAIELLRAVPGQERCLAQCLSNQSGTLKALGDPTGAIALSQEAVGLYRSLVARAPADTDFSRGLQPFVDDPRPALGDALIALSSHQNDANQRDECLASAQEAVDLFFVLSEQCPDQFRHHLGMARHNLGMAKFGIGDAAGGLREMQEAAAIYERLAKVHPSAFTPTYAHILGSLVRAYALNGREGDALSHGEACIALYRNLNKDASGRFIRELTSNLENLGILCRALGDTDRVKAIEYELALLRTNAGRHAAIASDVPDIGPTGQPNGSRTTVP